MYRDFKNFNETAFPEDVKLKNVSWKNDDSNQNYEFSFIPVLNLWLINTHPLKPKLSEEITFLLWTRLLKGNL